MRVKIVINTWTDTRTEEERAQPYYYKGYRSVSQVWAGEMDILSDKEYLTKVSVIAEGQAHPICDIPFAIGIGHWLWCPPESIGEDEDNDRGITSGRYVEGDTTIVGLFDQSHPTALPAMAIAADRRAKSPRLSFRRIWRRKDHNSHSS
jgi:hypothetical protein